MPTKPQTPKPLTDVNGAKILNTIRANAGDTYQASVPVAQSPGNGVSKSESLASLRAIGDVLMNFQDLQNTFLTNLVNRIARVYITSRLYENPWKNFKKGYLEYGEVVEEIFNRMAEGYQYDPIDAEETAFRQYEPNVDVTFHRLNFQKFYPITIQENTMRLAFLSWEGLNNLITRIIEQVYTGANYDEFMVMKYMIGRLALNGKIKAETIPPVTAENAREVTAQMINIARKLSFMSSNHNMAGVPNYTDPNFLQIILTTEVSSIFDVEVLALSFHMDKATLIGNMTYVDDFGEIDVNRLTKLFEKDPHTNFQPFTSEELEKLHSIQALMCDIDFFMIFDNLITMRDLDNPKGLYRNYFYHKWNTFSASPYANALIFTSEQNSVTELSITPESATASKGQNVQLSADVTTTGLASKNVIWSIKTPDSRSTVSSSGLVHISQAEKNTQITVLAVSQENSSISAEATITVQ